ncbi:hypothetical protein HOM50_04835 [bacterium]|nr:hypothetical protein [bacterium]MBT5015706.1 hypothetical protein [bacterium]
MKKHYGLYLILTFIGLIGNMDAKRIYIVPPGGYEDGKLFKLSNDWLNRDMVNQIWCDLKAELNRRGHTIQTVRMNANMNNCDALIVCGIFPQYFNVYQRLTNAGKRVISLLFEPKTVEPQSYNRNYYNHFTKVITMYDDDVREVGNCMKLHYAQPHLSMRESVSFSKKRLCTMINSNKSSNYKNSLYGERQNAVKELSKHPQDFTFYGQGWNVKRWKCYGGGVKSKSDTLVNFKFCICYDNTNDANGYITEKIFDSMQAGCVPVYLGAPNITDYVPAECLIDKRDFSSYEDLYNFMKNMTQEEYQKYIDNIQAFYASEMAERFSGAHFAKTVCEALAVE